jgi:hypothetical protein
MFGAFIVAVKYNKGGLIVIPTPSRHPDRSEAEWRDLFFVEHMNRSLHCASLRSAPVGMTVV